MSEKFREEYIARIQKVQDYIDENYWQNMSTEELASIAGFSKYHFNRIFKSVLQESLLQYINRIRLEHSLFMLAHRHDYNMTDIAYELGFGDSAVFSRAFKNYYGISPLAYRKKYSTNCKENIFISEYNKHEKKKKWVKNPFSTTGEMRIENLASKDVVYVRHVGTYKSLARAYAKLLHDLFKYAQKQNLLREGRNQLLAMYHDNPEFGKEEHFRTSLCLTIPDGCNAYEDGKLGVMKLEGGLYAIGHYEILKEQFEDAWDHMYQKWLMTSGYVPRNACPFEVYLNNPEEEKSHLIKVDIYVPIEPMK